MKASEILELVRAGFTKEEISTLENPQNEQENPQVKQTSVGSQETDNQVAETEKQTLGQDGQTETENKPESNLKAFQDSIKEMIQSNKDLMKVIQDSNLQNDSHGNNSIDDINHQAEDILKSIVAPVKEKEDKK